MLGAATTSTSAALRDGHRDLWETLVDHPFVLELAAGSLPLPTFRFYIEQDLLFLDDYARAIGFAAGRAADEDELGELARQLATVVGEELDKERVLLRHVEEILGTGPREVAAAPTTAAYSSFLLATAVRGDALDVMTALLPCAWSYADIGRKHIDAALVHPVYTDWINLFGGADYLEYVDRRLASFDRFAARAPEGRSARLTELFGTATRLERAFWDMAYAEEER